MSAKYIDFISHMGSKGSASNVYRDLLAEFKRNDIQTTPQYEDWKKHFIFAHGSLDTQRAISNEEFESYYNLKLSNKNELFYVLYILELYYVEVLSKIVFKLCSNIEVKNIINFTKPDLFIFNKNACLYEVIEKYFKKLDDNLFDKFKSEDIVNLYEKLFHKKIRHSIGAHFTPMWVCKHIIKKLRTENGALEGKTFLDPTCGSGIFLTTLMHDAPDEKEVYNNVYGFDINPVSIFAAKASYLLTLSKTNPDTYIRVLPFYCVDIVNNFTNKTYDGTLFEQENYLLQTQKTSIEISKNLKLSYNEFCNLYIGIVDGDISIIPDKVKGIYFKLAKIDNQNEIHNIMNLLSLVSVPKVDFVVGNPPWVNWEYLPHDYREQTKDIWQNYGLFDYKGLDFVFVKEDISSLITYIAMDKFLKSKGTLSFILKLSIVKSAKQAAGFRKFNISKSMTPIKPFLCIESSEVSFFNSSNINTIILFIKKGFQVKYPIRVEKWSPAKKRTRYFSEKSEKIALSKINISEGYVVPVNKDNPTSSWSFQYDDSEIHKGVFGSNKYQARIGTFTGGANGIFWLNILEKSSENLLKIKNCTERIKVKVPSVIKHIEKKYVYPLVVGRDIGLWKHGYTKYILMPHTKEGKMYPVDLNTIKMNTPKTYDYFSYFEKNLVQRKGFTSLDKKIHDNHFYTLQRIGEYTFKPYKVCWKYISKKMTPVVLSEICDPYLGKKIAIPNEKIVYIGFDDPDEAYYLCGVLSSKQYTNAIESFVMSTQISPSSLNQLYIPDFKPSDKIHTEIASICKEGHKQSNINGHIKRIDELVEQLLNQ